VYNQKYRGTSKVWLKARRFIVSESVLPAIISAIVALITAGTTIYFSFLKFKQEKTRFLHEIEDKRSGWVKEMKAYYSLELFKVRLKTYPEILETLGEMSTRATEPFTPEKSKQVAVRINRWLYSKGGLCATEETRGAILQIRNICFDWKEGLPPEKLFKLNDYAALFLRRDLDMKGLESYNFENSRSLLEEQRKDIESIK
jgi:hypothetical protein